MALTTLATGNKALLDQANPNELASLLQLLKLGSALRAGKTKLVNVSGAVANPYNLATLGAVTLPDDAKAATILRCYARAGGGTVGELTPQAAYTTPTAQQCAVAPNGDIVFLLATAWTSLDILYEPEIQDVVELFLPVVPGTGVCALPTTVNGIVNPPWNMLLEATALTGTVTGNSIVIAPGATPGSTRQVNLSAAKGQVQFLVADAVTSCRVKLGLQVANDINVLLEAAGGAIL